MHCRWTLPAKPPGKPNNIRVGSLALLQQIFLTQRLNWSLLNCRQFFLSAELSFNPFNPVLAFLQTRELRVPKVTELVCGRQTVSAQVFRTCACFWSHWTVTMGAVELSDAQRKGSLQNRLKVDQVQCRLSQ